MDKKLKGSFLSCFDERKRDRKGLAPDQEEGLICQRGLGRKRGTDASQEEETYRKDPTV